MILAGPGQELPRGEIVRSLYHSRIAGTLLAAALVLGSVLALAAPASATTTGQPGKGRILYVSKFRGKMSPNDGRNHGGSGCRSARFRTIQSAVNAAHSSGTVVVCPGTYREQVVLRRPLDLVGLDATINESGVKPTLTVNIPGVGPETIFAAVVIASSDVHVSGFKITNAVGEGVLAAGLNGDITGISIRHNTVVHNDLGFGTKTYFQCAPQGQVPGDCGEGVHFIAVAYSTISGNLIKGNSGGVLLSDDIGPTHNNVVAYNVVTGNQTDCGITVPGHNPNAVTAKGKLQPSVAGVYDNLIANNVVTDNGLKGEGAGILFANATAGTASYNNVVTRNFIEGNGLSGVTFHAHLIAPGAAQYLSGNVVVGNFIGKNNLDGDTLDSPHSPTDPFTTGVLVYSGGTRVRVTIARNHIANNKIGIWLSKTVTAFGLGTNTFFNVKVPISAHH